MTATRETKRAKCPSCCPDGGAIFERRYNLDLEHMVWHCRNCGHEHKTRPINRGPGKPNATQERVLSRLSAAFGGTHSSEMIGRKLFVKLDNESRQWFRGSFASIVIGPRGGFNGTLYRLGGDVEINDWIGVRVYFQD